MLFLPQIICTSLSLSNLSVKMGEALPVSLLYERSRTSVSKAEKNTVKGSWLSEERTVC